MWQDEPEAMAVTSGVSYRAYGQRMLKADGCTWTHVKYGNWHYRRIRYGEDGMAHGNARCHDCGARPRHYHHVGCDAEWCPMCRGQLTNYDYDISEYAEWPSRKRITK